MFAMANSVHGSGSVELAGPAGGRDLADVGVDIDPAAGLEVAGQGGCPAHRHGHPVHPGRQRDGGRAGGERRGADGVALGHGLGQDLVGQPLERAQVGRRIGLGRDELNGDHPVRDHGLSGRPGRDVGLRDHRRRARGCHDARSRPRVLARALHAGVCDGTAGNEQDHTDQDQDQRLPFHRTFPLFSANRTTCGDPPRRSPTAGPVGGYDGGVARYIGPLAILRRSVPGRSMKWSICPMYPRQPSAQNRPGRITATRHGCREFSFK